MPSPSSSLYPAKILVMGLGGAGCNLVNRLSDNPPPGVNLVLANTDAQALHTSRRGPIMVQLGEGSTRGLGAGANHQLGRMAAETSTEKLRELFHDVDLVFMTAGMGGGTGTGAAPVAAREARKAGALVVAVVTLPFEFEGTRRSRVAEEGIAALEAEVDTLLVLPNQKLLSIGAGVCPLSESFGIVDQVLCDAVRGMTEVVTTPGVINLDFADVRAVLQNGGRALFGMATAPTATSAVEQALKNPLVGGSPDGAAGALLNITAGPDLSIQDFSRASAMLQEAASPHALILCGLVQDPAMQGRVRATVVATQVNTQAEALAQREFEFALQAQQPELLTVTAAPAPAEPTAYERRLRPERPVGLSE
ncbi:MAG: cell division protein FtsZ, partial [Candidatus Eremiobacterota bacterium]